LHVGLRLLPTHGGGSGMVRQQRRKSRRTNRQGRRAEQHSGPSRRKLALALQGGGSHGAFTWGVLDRLVDAATNDIIGVTGTSAGATSGAILVDGLVGGGRTQARAKLRQYWEAVGVTPGFGSFFQEFPGRRPRLRLSKAFLHVPRGCVKTYRPTICP